MTPAEAAAAMPAAPRDTPQSLSADLALLESPAAPHPTAPPQLSGPQVGFAYVGLLRALSLAHDPAEQEFWKGEFRAIRTPRDAARFMTRAKLKIQFNISY